MILPRRKRVTTAKKHGQGRRLRLESLEPRQLLTGDTIVVLSELMYHPPSSQDLEWIELQSQLAVDVDLSGWRLDGGVDFQFPQGTVIPGDGYLVVAADPSALAADGFSGALGPYRGNLSNGGEQIDLLDTSGRVMDSLDYDDADPWPVAADGSGASLAKLDPHVAGGSVENWAASAQVGGTPATANFADPANPTGIPVVFNEVAAAGDPQFFVELVNHGSTTISLDGYVIGTSGGSQFEITTPSISPGGFVSFSPPELGQAVGPGDRLFLYASGADRVLDGLVVEDSLRGRSADGQGAWLTPDAPTPAAPNSFSFHDEIVINEIMYHPRPHFASPAMIRSTEPVGIGTGAGGNAWKVQQSDAFPGTGWNTVEFADTGWSSGDAIFFAGPFSGATDPSRTAITGLFNTGMTDTAEPPGTGPIADGQPDPHYVLVESPESTPPPPTIPATVMANHPAWLANDAMSKWIGPVHPGTANVAAGDYVFETTFDLSGFVPESALISMDLSADNTVRVLLNGEDTGITYGGFGGFSPTRTLDTGFHSGPNTLSFVLNNAGTSANPAGLRVKLSGTALPVPAGTELDLGPATYYFRREFQFDGNPAATQLQLQSLVDDGAVFYLNGVEVHRQNLPPGDVLHNTPAVSNVAGEAAFTPPVSIPADALRPGTNVLAVEVHQATGGFGDMAFGATLAATESGSAGSSFEENRAEWLELYNRGNTPVDLSGWRLDDGIQFAFAEGTSIDPGEYLVVAKEAASFAQEYPNTDVVGDFSSRLSDSGERIILLDEQGNPADEVHYYDKGQWAAYADGGGSSLELRDPDADNTVAEAWAASEESTKSEWQTITYRGVAAEPPGSNNPSGFHEFIFGLLDAGEILIDDVSVVRDPDGAAVELIQNGAFDVGTNKWRILGNHGDHGQTRVITDPDDPGNKVLHLVASGATEHMSNHVETTFARGERIVNGREYEISFRARWLAGSGQLHTRLYFNRLARTTVLQVPSENGTPGAANSRLEANLGPTYAELHHGPAVPKANQAVTISVVAVDPDGVSSMILRYSVNGGTFRSVAMSSSGDGLYTGVIPQRSAGSVVQFYVQGTDGLGARSTFPAAGPDSRALYKVDDGRATDGPHHNFRIIMTPADAAWQLSGTNALSNGRRGATVVFDESDIYYDVGVRLKGSGYSRGSSRTGYNVRFQPDRLFRGVHDVIAVDRTASAYGLGASHRELVVKHIATQAGGIPGMYDDLIYFLPPSNTLSPSTAQLLSARYDDTFLDSSYQDGSDGTRFKFELIYYPTGTVDGNPESPKVKPNTVLGVDFQNMGDDPEAYRWNHLIKNQRARDDYSQIVELGKTFSLSGSTNGGELDLRSQAVIDVDQWLRVFAFESLAGINDTYNQGLPHNLQVFARPGDDRVLALPWDMDFAFHQSTSMSVFGTGSNFRKIINVPNNLHYFYGHLHDIINTTYNTSYLTPWINHYAGFAERNVTSEIRNYINSRRSYVLGQLPATVPFAVTTGGGDFSVDATVATIEGNGWINVREIRLAGRERPLEVTWTAPDRWQVEVPLGPGANELIFEAFDFQGNPIGTDTVNVTSTITDRPLREHLRITEINYHPTDPTAFEVAQGFVDDDEFEFIELRNMGPEPLDLTGVAFEAGIQFEFTADEELPPPVRITEIGTLSMDWLEIQNLSFATAYTNGWMVAANNARDNEINDVHTLWSMPAAMEPEEALYLTDNWQDNYFGDRIYWRTAENGWVMIVDEGGSVVDFVVWGYSEADIATLTVQVGVFDVTAEDAWHGQSVQSRGGEFPYIRRSGSTDVDGASDWTFTDTESRGTTNAQLSLPFLGWGNQLDPGQFAVVVRNSAAFAERYGTQIAIAGEYLGRLDNGGERLSLNDRLGFPIFDFEYDDDGRWPSRPDGKGATLQPIDAALLPLTEPERAAFLQNGDNWQSGVEYGGSPGQEGIAAGSNTSSWNPAPLGVVINEVLTHTDPPLVDTIELFNTTDQPIDIGGWYLSDSWGWESDPDNGNYKKYLIAPGTIVDAGGYLVFDESHFNPSGGVDPQDHPYDFALSGAHGDDVWLMAADEAGNLTHFVDHVDFPDAAAGESFGRWPDAQGKLYPMRQRSLGSANVGPRVGPVVISEVMYNTAAPRAEGDPDDFEYIEIYNPTLDAIDLTNWRLRKGIDFDFPTGSVLAAGETLLVVSFAMTDAAKLTAMRDYYQLDPSVRIMGPYSGQLNDDGEKVQLQRPDSPPDGEPTYIPHLIEDEVIYGDVDPWPVEPDGTGTSLARQRLSAWGNDAASWTSETPTPGTVTITDDAYEPNNSLETASLPAADWNDTPLSSIDGPGIQADADWYRIDVAGNQRHLTVDLTFSHALGNVDLEVIDSAGSVHATSQTTTDDEQIDVVLAHPGTWYLKVLGDNLASAYDLVYSAGFLHPGDANLSGATDLSDFNIWNAHKFVAGTDWTRGDFNADGNTDLSDFNIWNAYKFTTAAAPDPAPPAAAGEEPVNSTAIIDDLAWLQASQQARRSKQSSDVGSLAPDAVDRLLATYWE